MKKLIIFLFCLTTWLPRAGGEVTTSDHIERFAPPGPNDVHIGPNVIAIPLGKILLVRKDGDYCAVKFTEFWTGKTKEDVYARYESYYQDDKTGDFSNKNAQFKKDRLSFPKPRGIGRLAFSFGKKNIRCGPIKLFWSGKGTVYFHSDGQAQSDYGIELSPTIWSDISEVNIFDPRIKWYKYDEERQRVNIPIEHLWKDKAE
jgi:hypothetical protein